VSGVVNPLYIAWKGQEKGRTVTYNRTLTISGGAPPGSAYTYPSALMKFTLSNFSAEQATIKVTTPDFKLNPQTFVIPAKLMPDDPALPKFVGAEELKIGGKTYGCTKYSYSTTSNAQIAFVTYGIPGDVTVWLSKGVPGGIVQREISVTIKASYDIIDTLAPKQ